MKNIQLLLLISYISFIFTSNIQIISDSQWPPSYTGRSRLNIRNNCLNNIVIQLDPSKPPCDKSGSVVPIGQCKGVDGSGWNNPANGNYPQKFLLTPGQIYSIVVPKNPSTGMTEWCFDEGNSRVCSGNGGWIGFNCDAGSLKCQSGDSLGFPYFPGRFEINFNPLPDGSIFYNLSGVDGINVDMEFTATGTCTADQKKTTCNLNLKNCPYPYPNFQACFSQCQACNMIAMGQGYPSSWNINDFTDPATGRFVDCKYLCAAGVCQDPQHTDCRQRVEGNGQYQPVVASKKWCDYIKGVDGGECDIYCWAYDDAQGTRVCKDDGDFNLDISCSQ